MQNKTTIFGQRESSESLDTTLVESDVPDLTIMRMAYLIERDFKEFYAEAIDMVEDANVKTLLQRLFQKAFQPAFPIRLIAGW